MPAAEPRAGAPTTSDGLRAAGGVPITAVPDTTTACLGRIRFLVCAEWYRRNGLRAVFGHGRDFPNWAGLRPLNVTSEGVGSSCRWP